MTCLSLFRPHNLASYVRPTFVHKGIPANKPIWAQLGFTWEAWAELGLGSRWYLRGIQLGPNWAHDRDEGDHVGQVGTQLGPSWAKLAQLGPNEKLLTKLIWPQSVAQFGPN